MKLTKQQFEQYKAVAVPITRLTNAPNGLNPQHAEAFKSADLIVGFDVARPDDHDDAMTIFHGRGAL